MLVNSTVTYSLTNGTDLFRLFIPLAGIQDGEFDRTRPTRGQDTQISGHDILSKGLNRSNTGLNKPTKGLNRPTRGHDRPTRGLNRPTRGLIRTTRGENIIVEEINEDEETVEATDEQNMPTRGLSIIPVGRLTNPTRGPSRGQIRPSRGQNRPARGQNRPSRGGNKISRGGNGATTGALNGRGTLRVVDPITLLERKGYERVQLEHIGTINQSITINIVHLNNRPFI